MGPPPHGARFRAASQRRPFHLADNKPSEEVGHRQKLAAILIFLNLWTPQHPYGSDKPAFDWIQPMQLPRGVLAT